MDKETYEALKNVIMSNRMLLGVKYGKRKRLTNSEVFEKATALRDIVQVENWIDEMAKTPETIKKIIIPMSEEDCEHIKSGKTFDWTFDNINVHIELEE